jgi:hypothetical protein
MILMLAYDFPSNFLYVDNSIVDVNATIDNKSTNSTNQTNSNQDPLNALADICLGILNVTTGLWDCVQNGQLAVSSVNYMLYAGVSISGVYAVILNPVPDTTVVTIEQLFFIQYMPQILIVTGVALLLITIGLYVFFRVYRYRGKYKETKEQTKKFEEKMQEMQMIGTSHLGQTLGDSMDNIIYTSNPSYRLVKQETKHERAEELQKLQESMLKRYRLLEKNNEQLKKNLENVEAEITRLKEYKDQLRQQRSSSVIDVKAEDD